MLTIFTTYVLPALLCVVAVGVMEYAFSTHFTDMFQRNPAFFSKVQPVAGIETDVERPVPVLAVATPAKAKLGDRGATPAHYRAFSLLQTRTDGARFSEALYSFRLNAKRIKLEEDETIRAEALRLMDSFVLLADEFAPLSDNLAGAELKAVNDAMRDTVLRLDASLDAILDGSTRSTDGFRTAVRFIETRYADEEPNPLSSI